MAQIQKEDVKKTKKPEPGTTKGFRGEGEADESVEGLDYAKESSKLKKDEEKEMDDSGGTSPRH